LRTERASCFTARVKIQQLIMALCCAVISTRAAEVSLTIDAGDFDRRDAPVTLQLRNSGSYSVELPSGAVPLQPDVGDRGIFILPQLKRGQKITARLVPTRADVAAKVVASTSDGAVKLSAFGKPVFTYHTQKTEFPANRPDLTPIFHRAAYIHPVLTPSGVEVTGDYPRNHRHHHGIWMAWTHTDFEGRAPDFWNMGDGKGTIEFVALDKTWSGPVHAGFIARHRYVDLTAPEPKTALNETWTVRALAVGQGTKTYYMFDVEVRDECATAAPVKLPQYRYGGLCVRGNWAWNGKTNAFVLTSEGETNRARGDKNQVHARWVHMGGFVDGKFAGIAALANPKNPGAPEPIRLNDAEPYFNFAPQQAGDYEIAPGEPHVVKYRFIVADGKPDRAELDRIWNDYAHPPTVTIGK
jgi:hypothetical protein